MLQRSRRMLLAVAVSMGLGLGSAVWAGPQEDRAEWSVAAAHVDPAVSDAAIARLRASGPQGLASLIEQHRAAILAYRANPTKKDPAFCNIASAVDRVAGQRDAWMSELYWYTDLEQAKAEAQRSHRPILSLRLLGTLDSELSCANSRFFRTVLYANTDLAKYLRENFVLHWKSVRPVPKVTIDFGDGRVVERTITGNSIHYVLDEEGLVVDGIPGLYDAEAFQDRLTQAKRIVAAWRPNPAERRWAEYARWHVDQEAAARGRWRDDLSAAGVAVKDAGGYVIAAPAPADASALGAARLAVGKSRGEIALARELTQPPAAAPKAGEAAPRATAKSRIEGDLVRALELPNGAIPAERRGPAVPARPVVAPSGDVLAAAMNDETWQKLAQLPARATRLHPMSRLLVRIKHLAKPGFAELPQAEQRVELIRLMENFESAIRLDTVKNEYTFHRSIHQWLASADKPIPVDQLNERVYAELFLTPSSDPWLGLAPEDAYSALDGGGYRRTK